MTGQTEYPKPKIQKCDTGGYFVVFGGIKLRCIVSCTGEPCLSLWEGDFELDKAESNHMFVRFKKYVPIGERHCKECGGLVDNNGRCLKNGNL